MEKIPTLFKRDFEHSHGRYVTEEVTPGCEWVLAGEGVPTRKYDGTCVFIRRDGLAVKAFARREVKADKQTPAGFVLIETDETTGKSVGWEPAEQSGFWKYIEEAIAYADRYGFILEPGTWELIGPKVQGNPEGVESHQLIRHAYAERLYGDVPRDFDGLCTYLTRPSFKFEGIVWHHDDGRMAKLKVRDFPKADA